MTKVTPWEDARFQAIVVAKQASSREGLWEDAIDGALFTLSRLGYRLVPAEATEEMVQAFWDCDASYRGSINAATEAGDVLREGK